VITKERSSRPYGKQNRQGAPSGQEKGPMLKGFEISYEQSKRVEAISVGGIGVMHKLIERIRLAETINEEVVLLKRHLSYFESDHILTLGYHVLCGGRCLQDIERLRSDAVFLKALSADRLPAPSTVGDFLRRFDQPAIEALTEVINKKRQRVWRYARGRLGHTAILDVDGTIAGTLGQCKEAMDISYKGIWGYAPLLISLAHTREVLYLVNRPGNQPSSYGAAPYIDQALSLVGGHFKKVYLRGDTDFSLTEHFDRWDDVCTFVFGFKNCKSLVQRAEAITAYKELVRKAPYEIKTKPRKKPDKVRPQRAIDRNYKTLRLLGEAVAEFDYRPSKCKKTYRMIVLRKHIAVYRGEILEKIKIRYLFYITNDRKKSAEEIVFFSNERCDQENVIAQLKHGIGALRLPAREFLANWAYMVCAAMAWNLKAFFALLCPDKRQGHELLRMEFKRFLNTIIYIPCQILIKGRRIVYRLLNENDYTPTMLKTFRYLAGLRFT